MPNAFPGIETALDAVVFDFDGVIVESLDIKADVFSALFSEESPAQRAAVVALHHAHGGIDRYVKFEMIHREILHRPLTAERKAWLGRRFEELVVERVVACPMVAGAQKTLDALKGRLPMAVASGTPDAELKDIIQRRGLSGYFVAAEGSPRRKAEIIAGLMIKYGWDASRVLMLGDAGADWEAARATGIGFIGRVPKDAVSPFPEGTALIRDLTELEKRAASGYSSFSSLNGKV